MFLSCNLVLPESSCTSILSTGWMVILPDLLVRLKLLWQWIICVLFTPFSEGFRPNLLRSLEFCWTEDYLNSTLHSCNCFIDAQEWSPQFWIASTVSSENVCPLLNEEGETRPFLRWAFFIFFFLSEFVEGTLLNEDDFLNVSPGVFLAQLLFCRLYWNLHSF